MEENLAGKAYIRHCDVARTSVTKFNDAVEEMQHSWAVKEAIRDGRYDPDAIETKRRQAVADMIEGLADLVRSTKAWEEFMTVTGADGKPLLLRLEEA